MQNKIFILAAVLSVASCVPVEEISNEDTSYDIFSRLCVSMLPEHGGSPRQPEPFPVSIIKTPDLPTYSRGQSVLITLRGASDFQFRGFLIQARAQGSTVPVGSWASGALGHAVGCIDPQPETFPYDGTDSAAHQIGTIRNVQELVWTAPEEPGTYRFELTTVERFGVYWMNQFSPIFNVV